MGGRIRGGVIVEAIAEAVLEAPAMVEVAEEDVAGKVAESHELELANASLPRARLELDRSCAKAGVESREFSEPDKIPAEPAVPGLSPCCCCCCWLLAAAMVPKRVVMKVALPAAKPAAKPVWSTGAGLGVMGDVTGLELFRSAVFHLLELLLLTTHFLMCFSKVDATLKGMAQNRHL